MRRQIKMLMLTSAIDFVICLTTIYVLLYAIEIYIGTSEHHLPLLGYSWLFSAVDILCPSHLSPVFLRVDFAVPEIDK